MYDATIDVGTERGKFPFVFCYDVIGGWIGVQAEGDIIDAENEEGELFKGIIEERTVIGFEMQFAVRFNDVAIHIQKIDINAVDLIIIENLIDIGDVEGGETNIIEIEIAAFASGGVKDGRLSF